MCVCVCVCVDQKSVSKLSEDKIFENKNNPPHEEMLFCNLTYNQPHISSQGYFS